MKKETFKELFEGARKRDEYWIAYAKLEFMENLRRLMEQKKETKASLAKKLGKSPAYITKISRGNVNFTLESMVRLVRAIGGRLKIELEAEVAEKAQVRPREKETTDIARLTSSAQIWVETFGTVTAAIPPGQTSNVSVRVITGKVGRAWMQELSSWKNEIQISPKLNFFISDKNRVENYVYATA